MQNIHRRTLDDTWRQVIRHCKGDDRALCGPTHDELLDTNNDEALTNYARSARLEEYREMAQDMVIRLEKQTNNWCREIIIAFAITTAVEAALAKERALVALRRDLFFDGAQITAAIEAERDACKTVALNHPVKFGPLDDSRRQSDAEMGALNARHQIADAIAARKTVNDRKE